MFILNTYTRTNNYLLFHARTQHFPFITVLYNMDVGYNYLYPIGNSPCGNNFILRTLDVVYYFLSKKNNAITQYNWL